jgi:hypothetical protein
MERKEARLGFRETCPACSSYLHSCAGCRYYAPGKPNSCEIPGTEWVADREGANFCDEFSPWEQRKGGGGDFHKFDSLFKHAFL